MKKLSIIITFLSVSLFAQTYVMEWEQPNDFILLNKVVKDLSYLSDYNGDGTPDIILFDAGNESTNPNIIIYDPSDNYNELISYSLNSGESVDYYNGNYQIWCAELNGDNQKELIISFYDTNYVAIINTLDNSRINLDSSPYYPKHIVDYDNDGKYEILLYNTESNKIQVWGDGSTSAETAYETIPSKYTLNQNYPNPFNPNTIINYQVQLSGDIELSIFDIKGRKIRKLVNKQKPVGDYQIKWDGTNDSGAPLSSGQYFYQLKVGYFTSTKKMVLLK